MNFFEQVGANIRATQNTQAERIAMSNLKAEEKRVKELFDALDTLANAIPTAPSAGSVAFDTLLDSAKRALINSKGVERTALVRAIARFENVHEPVPADPEVDK